MLNRIKTSLRVCCAVLSGLLAVEIANAEIINITTPTTTMLLDATEGYPLKFIYYGDAIPSSDYHSVAPYAQRWQNAYPVYGLNTQRETAMSVTHTDGNMTLDMEVVSTETAIESNGETTKSITMHDKDYPFSVKINYHTYPDNDIIEVWAEASNYGEGPMLLREFASAYLPIRYGNVYLTTFTGSWTNEANVTDEPLTPGMKVIKDKDGTRNSHTSHSELMFSLDGKPEENHGRTIGAALCYSGNYELRIETDDTDWHHFFAGINADNSSYILDSGETFVTPPLALTYSDKGKSGVSRNFHKWAREHKIAHGTELRKILLNSWEGVYFDINEAGMDQMMADIAGMGGELFVMDDGWFGNKYRRTTDKSSLGDWIVDTRKLPSGINGLLANAKKHGVSFGIWIEPEMTNLVSELYDNHPDYIIKASNRAPQVGRGGTQVVLDLSNPAVQDLVFSVVDTLLTNYPEIDYIKWDSNAPIMNHGSQYLPDNRQSHLFIDYHKGFAKVMDRIRAKYPDVTIQACAGGGGRANYGYLQWFDEIWVSDNTDALQRVYIQWGTSHFFPAVMMAAHISASPNHQTSRSISLKYRIDVAMSGRLGMEIQPKNMTDEEIAMCRNAIAEYKTIRPIVQQGDIYRLLSPYDKKGAASLMYVTPEKDKAVFYWWKTETFTHQHLPRITMAGLDPDKTYTIHELNRIDNTPLPYEGKSFSGRYLMSNGLEIPMEHNVDYHKRNAWASRVLTLTAN